VIVGGQGELLFAILGLLFGSLASALSYRLPRGLPVAADRSRCPSCENVLAARDLVPVLSWVASRGRCRYCDAKISWRYPLLELAMAGLFIAAWLRGGGDLGVAGLLAATSFTLVVIVVADLETGIIPDAMTLILGFVALGMRGMVLGHWIDGAAGAAAGFGVAWGVRVAFKAWRGRHGLGFGDVKFLGVAGLFVGISGLGAYLMMAGVFGIVMGIIWRVSGRGAVFPFGPALCAALLVGLYIPGTSELLNQLIERR
jgi:leader peptidase (prepilin peptidase)/N-methyltransferase